MSHDSTVTTLSAIGDGLRERATLGADGRAMHTFHGSEDARLIQMLLFLREGRMLDEHENPGEAMLQVIEGSARLLAGEDSWDLAAGQHVVIPQRDHALVATEDTLVLITAARENG
ncbi:cupin [Brachybacterium sp. DNPG3]